MYINSILIPIYDWNLTVFTNVRTDCDYDSVIKTCNQYEIPESITVDLLKNLKGKTNCGNHLFNGDKKISFIILSPINNEIDFWSIIPHEINHLIDRISESLGLDTEANSYLTGYIFRSFYQLNIFDNIKEDFITYKLSIPKNKCDIEQFLLNVGAITSTGDNKYVRNTIGDEMLNLLTFNMSDEDKSKDSKLDDTNSEVIGIKTNIDPKLNTSTK